MNPSRVLAGPAGLAVLAMLCACSGPGSTSKPTPTPTLKLTNSASPSPCQADTDSVTPGRSPLIQIILPVSAAKPATITARVQLSCGTTLNVTRNGSAVARFGTVAICQLMRYSGPVGTLISREPEGMLFSLTVGQVWCHDRTSQQEQALVCGTGKVYLTTITTNFSATCASNHVFHVAVYTGSVQVRYPRAKKNVTLQPGLQLAYDPATGQATPSAFTFSAADVSIFSALGS